MTNSLEIDADIKAILSEYSGKTLLSFNAVLRIDGYLLLHPSPKLIIKTIVSQRCTEDLIALFCLVPLGNKLIIRNLPKISENYWAKKTGVIFSEIMSRESPSFKKFGNSLDDYKKNLVSIQQSATNLLKEYLNLNNEEFDFEKYISSHRELLSYGSDTYMLSLLITTQSATNEDYLALVNAIWIFREALAIFRKK